MSGDEQGKIPTSLRTLRILEVIARSFTAMTPTEINATLGLPKQTVHRLCTRLLAEGFIAYVPGTKRLRPARRLREMATGLMSASEIHLARRQILEDLAARIGETVNFVVPAEGGMSYLDRVETDWALRVQLPIGTNVPFHCTASGKTFMASLPEARRIKFLQSLDMKRLTANTITGMDEMMGELQTIAAQGHAFDREEFMQGMVAIAVPVSDEAGRFLAALAYHGPSIRLNEAHFLSNKSLLQDAARRIAGVITQD
jgi:DNA-binding IclR family transcriptional regulator